MKRRADKTGKQRAQTFRRGEIRVVKPGTFDYQTDGCAFRKGRVLFPALRNASHLPDRQKRATMEQIKAGRRGCVKRLLCFDGVHFSSEGHAAFAAGLSLRLAALTGS